MTVPSVPLQQGHLLELVPQSHPALDILNSEALLSAQNPHVLTPPVHQTSFQPLRALPSCVFSVLSVYQRSFDFLSRVQIPPSVTSNTLSQPSPPPAPCGSLAPSDRCWSCMSPSLLPCPAVPEKTCNLARGSSEKIWFAALAESLVSPGPIYLSSFPCTSSIPQCP